MDFLLTAKRDLAAPRRFFERAINLHDLPISITIDKSGANTAAINSVIETMHMIKKGQLHCPEGQSLSAAEQFYGMAF